MKHDSKLHHWLRLLAQLEEKYQKLEIEYQLLNDKLQKSYDLNGNLCWKHCDKIQHISNQFADLEQRIHRIKSQIDQYH